jgi:hypothetical protein
MLWTPDFARITFRILCFETWSDQVMYMNAVLKTFLMADNSYVVTVAGMYQPSVPER